MAISANTLIKQSLKVLGELGQGEPLDGTEAQDGLITLNQMVDALGIERHWLHTVLRNLYSLTSGTQDYTIGTGATFNVERPTWIDSVSVIPDSTVAAPSRTELPMGRPLTVAQWQAIAVKGTTSAFPTAIYYDFENTALVATISVYPIPDQSNVQLVLYFPGIAVANFADLSTTYSFVRGYERALKFLLAVELADEYGVNVSPRVERLANEAAAVVKRGNLRPVDAQIDPAIAGQTAGIGYYDWRSDR